MSRPIRGISTTDPVFSCEGRDREERQTMDGTTAGYALVGALGLTLLCLGRLAQRDDRFWGALVRHTDDQRRLHRQPSLPADWYARDRRPVGLALRGSGWVLLLVGLVPLLGSALRP
jgi:hypothetical protein